MILKIIPLNFGEPSFCCFQKTFQKYMYKKKTQIEPKT